jgi:hypothetical protein
MGRFRGNKHVGSPTNAHSANSNLPSHISARRAKPTWLSFLQHIGQIISVLGFAEALEIEEKERKLQSSFLNHELEPEPSQLTSFPPMLFEGLKKGKVVFVLLL